MSTSFSPDNQPGSRRETDPTALAIFRVLRDRDAVDLRFVLGRCERILTGLTTVERTERQTLGTNALRDYANGHGGAWPSRAQYDAWRTACTSRAGLPNSGWISRAFDGSWEAAKAAARGGEPVNVLSARRLRALGPAFGPEELVAAIARCAADLGNPESLSFTEYRAWAERRLAEDPGARLALGQQTFTNHGGWVALSRRAGVRQSNRSDGQYGDDEIVEALRGAWDAAGRPWRLRRAAYEAWRRAELAVDRAARVPSMTVVLRRYGTWSGALLAADVIDTETAVRLASRRHEMPISPDFALRCLVAATDACQPSLLTPTAYERWRLGGARVDGRPVPSASWIRKAFMTFSDALTLATKGGDFDGR